MQDVKRNVPRLWGQCLLGLWIAVAVTASVFLASSVCAQDSPGQISRGQRECETLYTVAVRAEKQNDFIEAELRYEECLELARQHRLPRLEAAALHRLAVIRARNKKFSESANLFRRALDLEPRNAFILSDFAQLHTERKDYVEAENLFKRALEADPNNRNILFNLGSIVALQRSDRQAEGLRYLKLAVGEADAYRELAKIYRSKGDLERAQFAERKAQEALAAGNTAPTGRLLQRTEHQQLTPSEVVNQVRQELADSDMRRSIGEQVQQAVPPPGIPVPFIPSMIPSTPQPTAQPRQVSLVRHLGPPALPTATLGETSSGLRALPSKSAFPSVSPSFQQPSGATDPFAPVQTPGAPSSPNPQTFIYTPSNNAAPTSIAPPIKTEKNHLLVRSLAFTPQPPKRETGLEVLPVRDEPVGDDTVQFASSYSAPSEHTDMGNPLRVRPLANEGLIDPVADVSIIASLPSFSAVEARTPSRIEENTPLTRLEDIERETQQSDNLLAFEHIRSAAESIPTEKNGVVRNVTAHPSRSSLPVREIDVLQSPSNVIARRDTPHETTEVRNLSPIPSVQSGTEQKDIEKKTALQENVYHIANLRSGQSSPATPSTPVQAVPIRPAAPAAEIREIASNNRHFVSANAPSVLAFGIPQKEEPPVEVPIEIAAVEDAEVRSIEPNDTAPIVASMVMRLPQREDVEINTEELALPTHASDPFPLFAGVVPPSMGAALDDPFPIRNELAMNTPATTTSPVNDTVKNEIPHVAEVRKIEPQPFPSASPAPVLSLPMSPLPTNPTPVDSVPLLANTRPPAALPPSAVVEEKRSVPMPVASPVDPVPVLVSVKPSTPPPVAAEPVKTVPILAEAKPPLPQPTISVSPTLEPVVPAPVEPVPVLVAVKTLPPPPPAAESAKPLPVLAETKPSIPEPVAAVPVESVPTFAVAPAPPVTAAPVETVPMVVAMTPPTPAPETATFVIPHPAVAAVKPPASEPSSPAPPTVAAMPGEPIPVENDMPRFVEVAKVEPQRPVPPPTPVIAAFPDPFAVIGNEPPRFSNVVAIKPPPVISSPAPASPTPTIDSFLVAANQTPVFARPAPPTRIAPTPSIPAPVAPATAATTPVETAHVLTPPVSVAQVPAPPVSVAQVPAPSVSVAQVPAPLVSAAQVPAPVVQTPAEVPQFVVAASPTPVISAPVAPQPPPVVSPPAAKEPMGFASTRKPGVSQSEPKVMVAEDRAPGFARTRK